MPQRTDELKNDKNVKKCKQSRARSYINLTGKIAHAVQLSTQRNNVKHELNYTKMSQVNVIKMQMQKRAKFALNWCC